MFELLLQLPLFQGLSTDTLSALVEKYPFHFLKFRDGDKIVEVGETVTHARFIVSGNVRLNMPFNRLQVTLSQTLTAPQVLGPDWLFGMTTTSPYDVAALGDCGILQITKSDYITMLQSDKVLLFNILNYLSLRGQRSATSMMDIQQGSVSERLALLVKTFTTRTSSDVELTFRQKDLCTLLGTQRNSMQKAMNELTEKELVNFSSNKLEILNLRDFLSHNK